MITNIFSISVEDFGIKKLMPAYLDSNLKVEDLKTGVSFASGASGFDLLTPVVAVTSYSI